MSIQFRDYQLEAIHSIWEYFQHRDGNPLVAMPTASGKSIVIAGFCQSALYAYPSTRIMVVTHVKELIAQNFAKLRTLWPQAPAGIYSAGLGRKDYLAQVLFAGIGSVAKRPELFGRVDVVLIDEAHLVSPNDETMYGTFLAALKQQNPKLKVIGFSATCYRLGLGLLTEGGLFTDICYDLTRMESFNRLIAAGYLCPLVTKRTSYEIDVSGVGTRGGEFIESQLQEAVNRDHVTSKALDELCKAAADRQRWLIFATGLEHCERISELLFERGIETVVVHSKLPASVRDARIADFKSGQVRVAINNNILTTGIDVPEIDCEAILRPTKSTSLWVQMLGRGTRPSPGKQNCLVLDFAGNTRRLGPINDPVIPKKPGKKSKELGAPIKVCEKCGSYVHASLRECPDCGAEFPRFIKITDKASDLEVMKTESPVVELLDVERVTYHSNWKRGKPTSLRVSYFCGLRMFKEFVCLEHEGFARRKAERWWLDRAPALAPDGSPVPLPATIDQALQFVGLLRIPRRIRVWTNRNPYPEVMGYEYET